MDNKKGYKGFGPGLVCLGKQYAENTEYEEAGGSICKAGMMHYCPRGLDVLGHYPPVDENGRWNEFAAVEALDEPVTDNGSKYATKKIRIGKKLSFADLVEETVRYDIAHIEHQHGNAQTGYRSGNAQTGECSGNAQAGGYSGNAQTGDYSGNSQTGWRSGNAQTGYRSGNAQTGHRSGNAQTGYRSGNAQTGYRSGNAQTGDYSGNSQTGDRSGNAQTGDYSGNSQTGDRSGNSQTGDCSGNAQTGNYSGNSQTGWRSGNAQTGNYSGNAQTGDRSGSIQTGRLSASVSTGIGCTHEANGEQCIAVGWGRDTKAKGAKGSYLVLCEYYPRKDAIKHAAMAKIDGKKIKADTWYKLQGGEFVEVQEDK